LSFFLAFGTDISSKTFFALQPNFLCVKDNLTMG